MPTTRAQLLHAFDEILQPGRFKDFGPNGLQVEGRSDIARLVSGVTGSLALIDAAIADGADAIVVHHGLFWRGQQGCVTGWMRQRLGRLLTHDVSLFAYHLPLDAHAELGNNARLGILLGLHADTSFGDQGLGCIGQGDFDDAAALAAHVGRVLDRRPVLVDSARRPVRRVAWCTGGAQSFFESAIAAGADAFITGEISEPQAHYAREMGVAYIAAGHHATERYGVAALGAHVAERFGLEHRFIDIDNPA